MEIAKLYTFFRNATEISTDTRKLKKGALFFALSGPNFDANQFAEQALDKGASAVIIDDPKLNLKKTNVVLVDNVLHTLQALASYHRKELKTPLIALTGSNGKTTTKELIREVLSSKYKVLATQGNLNNHIGVPLTLLKLKPDHEIGIIEMGANHPGEIATLSEIVNPNWGFITNFGKAHLEGFGSLDGVIRSKSELYVHLINNKQNILINADDSEQRKQTQNYKVSSFGQTNKADFVWENLHLSPEEGIEIKFEGQNYLSRLYGSYNTNNLAAALSFGALFKVPTDKIRKVLLKYVSENNRSQIISIRQTVYILDAYNANPSSVSLALENFHLADHPKKIVILGDMFELGEAAKMEHQSIVDLTNALNFNRCIFVGEHYDATDAHETYRLFSDLKSQLNQTPIQDAFILIKGSRGMALERLLEVID